MLTPETEEHLSEIIRGANGPLSVRGGGTRHVPTSGEALTTSRMSGITLYEPGALTLVARAGTSMAEIEAALASENQRLPFEPPDYRALLGREGEPTIGGAVATNASGPRRVAAGACRDSLIGVRFVDGHGDVIKNGGRVMKNVTGYDLVKLLAGSKGTLGVLTAVSLKVLPAAATQTTLSLGGLSVTEAMRAMAAGLSSPFEVSAAAHSVSAGQTWLRLEGLEGSVDYRAAELAQVLAGFGATTRLDPDSSAVIWTQVRDAAPVAGQGDLWRLSVRSSHAPELIARAQATDTLMDWGGGLVWLRVPEGTDLRTRLGEFSGHATRVRGDGPGSEHPEPAALAALTAGVRTQFDPRGIFNPTGGA